MKESNTPLKVDLDKIVADKTKNSKTKIPKFVVSLIKKIVHQDEVNYYLERNKEYQGVDFATYFLKDINVKFKAHYEEELDLNKKYVFVSNHPLGGIDGLILISYIGQLFGKVRFVVNDFLMNLKPLEECFVPVNKLGRMNLDSGRELNKAFDSEAQVLYFPAGLCSRLIKGKIIDLPWRQSFLKKAKESGRDIVPIYFEGRNSMFFYRLAKFRKWVKIKFNVEMIFLPNELFKKKNTTFDLYIKKPISIEEIINSDQSNSYWVDKIRKTVYETNN